MKFNSALFLLTSFGFLTASCTNTTIDNTKVTAAPISVADSVLNLAIKAHGSSIHDTASFSFVFRTQRYTTSHENGQTKYTVMSTGDDARVFEDVLIGSTLTRKIDGEKFNLPEDRITKISSALNSVIYFATLPYKLQDEAVQIVYDGPQVVKGEPYLGLEVTFAEEGGGEDHDDMFYYWVNANTHTIDYLAYSYKVNNGGIRFREAFNPRYVNGALFQDYVNYEAPIGTTLNTLPKLLALDSLKQLSLIKTENVKQL